jgi:hypothetical protein
MLDTAGKLDDCAMLFFIKKPFQPIVQEYPNKGTKLKGI